jgi:DNA-binding CsgD family transcriptional regulator/tetratricopeptide (TPR) repeat protein
VGRDRELAAVRRLLDAVLAGEAAALHVEGEPGMGKTLLMEQARSMAAGFTCLSSTGAESDATLAHAGLLELLTPLRHLLAEVPEGQAAALGVALGWTSSNAPADRFLVAAGTLSLLAAAAVATPVLVLVDDLHWLDRESADAILFAARRLNADAVGFVTSARSGVLSPELVHGLPVLHLGALDARQAAELLRADVAVPVVDRLTELTGGNPLALLEVSGRLSAAQRVGASPLPDALPVGARLHTVYDAVVGTLPDDVRLAVLLTALDRSAAVSAAPPESFDEAVARGVLVPGRTGHEFRHPLIRSATLRLATPSQLRDAHRVLAAHVPRGSAAHAHHCAGAATGPDDEVADALAQTAAEERSRLGYAAAAAALERSALLTRDHRVAADRLAAAAQDAFVAGDLALTRGLVDRVLASGAADETRGRALFTLGMMEQYAGSVARAADHLTGACAVLRGAELVDALTERALVAFRLNDLATFADCAAGIEAAADVDDPAQHLRLRFTGGVARAVAGDHESAQAMLVGLTDLALSEELRDDPRSLLVMALAAGLTGTVGDAVQRGAVRIDDIRRRGAIGVLVPVLAISASGRATVGDHARAFAEAGEAVELADWLGYVADAAVAVEQLAWQYAARGLHDDARVALDRARQLIDRAETTTAASHYALTAAFCALCREDLALVVELLEARFAIDGGVGAMGEPLGVAPLLVEAYVGLGRAEDALGLARRLADATPAAAPVELTAQAQRCLALAARDTDESHQWFEAALEAYASHCDPFERARTRLMFGSRLRRDGLRVLAREQLRAAHAAFTELELTRWVRVAAAELNATGATVRSTADSEAHDLTSQETRVALLVAAGKSNKEVAAALFLSPRTVERHLGSVFRKKGFRSRTELTRAYAARVDAVDDNG